MKELLFVAGLFLLIVILTFLPPFLPTRIAPLGMIVAVISDLAFCFKMAK